MHEKKISLFYNDITSIISKAMHKESNGEGIKILTPK